MDFIKNWFSCCFKNLQLVKTLIFLFCVVVILRKGQVCDVVIELLLIRDIYTVSFGLWSLE